MPAFEAESAILLDQFISCRQWLIRTHPYMDPALVQDELWVPPRNSGDADDTFLFPGWDIFQLLYALASGHFPNLNAPPQIHDSVLNAVEGAISEMDSGRQIALASLLVLNERKDVLASVVKGYNDIIEGLKNNTYSV